MKLSENLEQKLRCPATKEKLIRKNEFFESVKDSSIRYPIVDGIPVLIDDKKSLFAVDDFKQKVNTTFNLKKQSMLKETLYELIPEISINLKSKKNYSKIIEILPKNAKILIVGGSIKGYGMDPIYDNESYEIASSDISFGPYANLISDAHDIPFDDEVFDCVIIQAVLEHVVEPERCVGEIHRVLKDSGLVYAETPFMQQVHMQQYDFTRFTHLGHRRLFRYFEEISSGPVGGPGMALAWSYTYFLRSFATKHRMSRLLIYFGQFTSFFLKYFDYFLVDKPGSYDAASGLFFMGTKSSEALSDRDLIKQFKGVL